MKYTSRDLAPALDAWRALLGPEGVDTDAVTLEEASTATFATQRRALAVLRPTRRDQVPRILELATRHQVPIHPYSSGRNWGFGSRVPPTDAVLLELRGLNRILDFDEELGWIEVEPGVSFGQVSQFLREQGSRRFLCVTGAHPDTSLVGNALQRGDAIGPYGDRVRYACRMEVALPTGQTVVTGFGAVPSSRAQALFVHGTGPALDGLFAQSSLGVVTRMTFWLPRRPAVLMVAQFGTRGRIGAMAAALSELRQERSQRAPVGLWNDYRAASVRSTYPWNLHDGRGALPLEHLASLLGGSPLRWFGVATDYAPTPGFAEAWRERVRAALEPCTDHLAFEAFRDEDHAGTDDDGTAVLGSASALVDVARGVPRPDSTRSCYWRRSSVPEQMHPDLDGCGVLWHACVVPMRGDDVQQATDSSAEVLTRHGFEPMLALVNQHERVTYLYPMILFDRSAAGQDEQAIACMRDLHRTLQDEGFSAYRMAHAVVGDLAPQRTDDSAAVLDRLGEALDPAGVLYRGRRDRPEG
ncbi:MAG: FAD-binding oxidoreductase [Myxococcales bacterium]|nr:FAD-binding oxidoreductase [Myxococcales bacterium]